jgi:hypothetical protein
VEHLNRAEEEGNDLRAPGKLDQSDTQDYGLEILIDSETFRLSSEITSSLVHK